jgi:hypothetical protein
MCIVIEPFFAFKIDTFERVGWLDAAIRLALPDGLVEAIEKDLAAVGTGPYAVGQIVPSREHGFG